MNMAPRDSQADHEPQAVVQRYAARDGVRDAARYSLFDPAALAMHQERQRATVWLLKQRGWAGRLHEARIVELGCGHGGNLLDLLRLGARPEHLTGLELLPERAEAARAHLPPQATVIAGDALAAPIAPGSVDIVLLATVFSSLLDDAFQQRLAEQLWSWLAPGGAVLWYDFVYDNPANRDVRGVPLARVRELFPRGRVAAHRRVTLAPPIARRVARVHPALYTLFNGLPLLRTHVLAWIDNPRS